MQLKYILCLIKFLLLQYCCRIIRIFLLTQTLFNQLLLSMEQYLPTQNKHNCNGQQSIIEVNQGQVGYSVKNEQNLPSPIKSNVNNRRQSSVPTLQAQFKPYGVVVIKSSASHKKQNKSNKNLFNKSEIKKTASAQIQTYKDWKIYRNKSDLNMLPFPYCIDQQFQQKREFSSPLSLFTSLRSHNKQKNKKNQQKPANLPRLYKLKVQNKVQVHKQSQKQNKVYRPFFNYEKTPINEYLNYELAEQINTGLRDVQIVAEQIRRIKKAKKVDNQVIANQKNKLTKGLRIRRSYVKNFKGVYKSES